MKLRLSCLEKIGLLTIMILICPVLAFGSASFSFSTGRLIIPRTCLPNNGVYRAELSVINQNFIFELGSITKVPASANCDAGFRFDTGILNINRVEATFQNNEVRPFEVDLLINPNTSSSQFSLVRADELIPTNFQRELQLFSISFKDQGPLPQHIPFNNMTAFTMLVPENWNFNGAVVWDLQTLKLASLGVFLTGSDNVTGVHLHPTFTHVWAPNQGIGNPGGLFPEGSYVHGGRVMSPLSSRDYLLTNIIPAKRPQFQIIEEEPLPRITQAVLNNNPPVLGSTVTADAIRLRIQYTDSASGTLVEEDFYASIVFNSNPVSGLLVHAPIEIYSLRAPQGTLNARTGFLYSLVRSVSLNQVWYANYLSIVNLAIETRQNQTQTAALISQILVTNAEQVRAEQRAEWQRQQTIRDTIFEAATDTILGVTDFRDPSTGETIELTNDFQRVWRGTDGRYIFSNDSLFDPNVDPNLPSNINWTQLLRQNP